MTVLKTIEYNQSEVNIVTGNIDYEGYIEQGIFYRFKARIEKEEVVKEYLYTYLNERLFLTNVEDITVHLTERDLEITAKAYVNIPTFGGLFGNDYNLSFKLVKENIIDAREFVRIFDVLGGVIEKVPGTDSAIELLQNMLEALK